MKILFTTIGFLALIGLTAIWQGLKPTNQTERKVIQMIANLPEIIEDNKYMTKRGRPYQIYIEDTPGDRTNYYRVAVSEYNGANLVPHYRFLVKPKTYAIYYLDFLNDNFKPIPLNVWRKRLAWKNSIKH